MKLPYDRSIEVVKAFFCRTDSELDSCIEALAPYLEASYGTEDCQVSTSIRDSIEQCRVVNDPLTGRMATITKIRFNFKEVMRNGEVLEVILPPIETLHISDHYLKAVVFALLFLRNAQQLPLLGIDLEEALVLTAMVRLEQTQGVVTQEDIEAYLQEQLDTRTFKTALRNLDLLGCITLRPDEVILKEAIEINSAEAAQV